MGNVSSFGTWSLNSRFIVITTDEVILDRPEVCTGFSVTLLVKSVEILRNHLWFLRWILSLLTVGSRFWGGFSEFVVSSRQFRCTICNCEFPFMSFLFCQYFFRVDPSRLNFWCVHFCQFFQIHNQSISFPNSTGDQCLAKKDPRTWTFRDSNSIPLNQPTIFHPILSNTPEVAMFHSSNGSLSEPLVSDRWGVEVRWFHAMSYMILQIPLNWKCK